MKTKAVLAFFDGNQRQISRVLGITPPSVCEWGDVVPEVHAYRLERITGGKLKADHALYDRLHKRNPWPLDVVMSLPIGGKDGRRSIINRGP
jgi:transcriptional repressor of cell division inhibition gene dicB